MIADAIATMLHVAEFHGVEYKAHSHAHQHEHRAEIEHSEDEQADHKGSSENPGHHSHHICSHDSHCYAAEKWCVPIHSRISLSKESYFEVFDSPDQLGGIFRPPVTQFS